MPNLQGFWNDQAKVIAQHPCIRTDELENNIQYLLQEQNEKSLKITLHPHTYAFLTKGFPSIQHKWFMKFNKWIKLEPVSSHHMLEYHFFNKNDENCHVQGLKIRGVNVKKILSRVFTSTQNMIMH